MKYLEVILITLVACVLLGAGVYLRQRDLPTERPVPRATERSVSAPAHIEVASTSASRELGLGGRTRVPDDYGMLFIFDTPDTYGFWMKGMIVPIDIVFLANDGTIMTMYENVAPETYPKVFYPKEPVKYVLEVRAGGARAHGYLKGTRIEGLIPTENK